MPTTGPAEAAAVADELLAQLLAQANLANLAGMARYGISTEAALGVPVPVLRAMARELRPLRRSDPYAVHEVAARLWASGVHEARMLAGFLDVPALVTPEQADAWVADLDSWDSTDQLQGLFAQTPFAYDKADEWVRRDETFARRAGLVLICTLAVHDKRAPDERLVAFLPLVEAAADDERPMVSKAVSWALRQVGKRSPACHAAAVAAAERILAAHPGRGGSAGARAARWAATDALRELRSDAVRGRLGLA